MGLFSKIVDKIFHHDQPKAAPGASTPATASAVASVAPAQATPATPAAAPAAPVDVEAVLTSMAEIDGGGGNWRTSIVDLLKLLKLDSSLEARKGLADELGVHAGEAGSAEQNIALHKAVMKKLAENGGQVPERLSHLVARRSLRRPAPPAVKCAAGREEAPAPGRRPRGPGQRGQPIQRASECARSVVIGMACFQTRAGANVALASRSGRLRRRRSRRRRVPRRIVGVTRQSAREIGRAVTPPHVAPLAQRHLGGVDVPPGGGDGLLILRRQAVAHRATRHHELRDKMVFRCGR